MTLEIFSNNLTNQIFSCILGMGFRLNWQIWSEKNAIIVLRLIQLWTLQVKFHVGQVRFCLIYKITIVIQALKAISKKFKQFAKTQS